jgi:tryptophan synthase beta chain
MPAIEELSEKYAYFNGDPEFIRELDEIRKNYMGRPTPLYFAKRLTEKYGCKIFLKREDLVHGGAHKLNNTMGQGLLAKKMGKKKLIAETGAGQHGFATAIAGAYFGMPVTIFMGSVDMKRQAYNVHRMRMLGATVVPVENGSKTLKEAVSEGLRYWITNVDDSHYLMGSVVGPHPFPMIVRDFQRVIGQEIKRNILALESKMPTAVVACAGGGSNAMGTFYDFIEDENVQLYGVEAAGIGNEMGQHCMSLGKGAEGILHGARQYLLQDEHGNVADTHSISAGLDYPGVGPELCHLKKIHRLYTGGATDKEAIEACIELSRMEGIIPALESSHAVAFGLNLARTMKRDDILVINVSGQGGKDIETLIKQLELMEK